MGSKKNSRIDIHNGRIRKLIEFLKEHDVELKVYNTTEQGERYSFVYSDTKSADLSLKDFFYTVWEDQENAVNEYFRSDYEVVDERSDFKQKKPSHRNQIANIKCTYRYGKEAKNGNWKDFVFFKGDKPEVGSFDLAFPDIRMKIKRRIHKYSEKVLEDLSNIPFSRLFRDEELEGYVFEYLSTLGTSQKEEFIKRFNKLIEAYAKELDDIQELENHDIPSDKFGFLLPGYDGFEELSHPNDYWVPKTNGELLDKYNLDCFSNEDSWFTAIRYLKIDFWRDELLKKQVSAWPKFWIEHVVLAHIEINAICSILFTLRNELYEGLSFRVKYFDGKRHTIFRNVNSKEELLKVLKDYDYEADAFKRDLSDGHLLSKRLINYSTVLQKEENNPPYLYRQTLEDILSAYLLKKMCEYTSFNLKFIKSITVLGD